MAKGSSFDRKMIVRGEDFKAGATFRCVNGNWSVIKVAPPLRWMMGYDMDYIKSGLLERNLRWEWL
jgi:hypothetical protein